MTILVIAEHDNVSLKPETGKIINAASQIGGDIHLLVAGHDCAGVAQAASQLSGVSTVLLADNVVYRAHLAQNLARLVVEVAADYSYILAAASSQGKDMLPRVAALLDVSQLSEVVSIVDASTFIRPVY
ncbi:MAG: electron transfer flavoprotein subunit alpha/FixB family protein, partial [Shewanella sp.]|nr:electron transfer flavoprotein subunit alpha/FixB family protein [Shewanella sp.]